MNAIFRYKLGAMGLLISTMLTASLTGCDRGTDNTADTVKGDTSNVYNTGFEFGLKLNALRQQQPDIDINEAFQGLLDALAETNMQFDTTALCTVLQSPRNSAPPTAQQTELPTRLAASKDDFATLNARRPGVTVLPSGVQYEVLKKGNGNKPSESDSVLLNYEGTLATGTVFDTTYEDGEPLQMSINEIAAPGLKEALLLMDEGAQWRVVIPPSMGFGRTGNNQLRRRDLIYEMELVSIVKPGSPE